MNPQILWIVFGGAFGGLVKALFDGEHKLMKPVFKGRYFYMGFIGNLIVGIGSAIVGIGYLFRVNNLGATNFSILELLATSIAFGIASNSVIEGVVEKLAPAGDHQLTDQDLGE